MNVLVIGANGFLGSNLVNKLIEHKHQVIAVYNQNKNKINKQAKFIPFDEIRSLDAKSIDLVFYVSGSFSSSHTDLIKINCKDLIMVSEYFKDAKLVYISSINVYGVSESVIEEDSCFNGPNIYGLSKIAGEFITKNHAKYAILRLCYLYGPELNNNSFLPRLIQQAKSDKEMVLFGEGERAQDYLYISDAVELCRIAGNYPQNDIFLGATGKSYSNKFIASLIKSSEDGITIKHEGEEVGKSIYFNPAQTFKKLEWSPKVSMSEGIKNMWNESIDLR